MPQNNSANKTPYQPPKKKIIPLKSSAGLIRNLPKDIRSNKISASKGMLYILIFIVLLAGIALFAKASGLIK
ncbi:hypothetical protein KBD11_02385 [Candidatus Saccharibacteria bacterium]|nr:hypothetical protein [Candidatus Saccharibacteria bacterium]